MQRVFCVEHERLCFLKTGTRDGPNKGKSFYICGVRCKTPCGYMQSADIPASHCLLHGEFLVELQALIKQQDGEKYRLYFRCVKSKCDGKWCGSIPWKDSTELPENGKSFHSLEKLHPKPERNPFKIKSGDQKLSLWKLDKERKEKEAQNERDHSPDTGEGECPGESCRQKGIKEKTLGTEEKCVSVLEDGLRPVDKLQKHQSLSDGRVPQGKLESCEKETRKQMEPPREERSSEGDQTGQHRKQETPAKETLTGEETKLKLLLQKLEARHSEDQNKNHKDRENKVKGNLADKSEEEIPKPNRSRNGKEQRDCFMSAAKYGSEDGTMPKAATSATVSKENGERTDGCDGIADNGKLKQDKHFQQMKLQGAEYPVKKSRELGQKTITSFPGFSLASQVIGSKHQDFAALHNQLTVQLKQKKTILASVNVQALPDKGQRLQTKVKELEDALSSLSLTTPVENDVKKAEAEVEEKQPADDRNPFSRTAAMQQSSPLPFQDLQSRSLGSASSIGASQFYSQVGGGKSQQQSLYVEGMTEDHLFTVRNATSEAIDFLHKSLESCPSTGSTMEDPGGLKVPLLLHQKQALAWLLWRETQKPQGGILADDMGLGKTLTMIALILTQKNREERGKNDKMEIWLSKQDSSVIASRATLVICPASLVHHWKKEVDKQIESGKLRVYLYHGPNREKNSRLLSGYDIVVTTYGLAAKEIPVQKRGGESFSGDQVEDGSCSPLLRVAWRRIILDEAHAIRNPKAQTSIAMCKLSASARWAVTGTPIQNNLLDMYSLLKFLRCTPFDDYRVWKSQVDNCSKKGGERLIILTMSLLLRRTKDQMDAAGKPLVPLPQRRCRLHQLKLSEDEQAVYNVLFVRSRSTLQSYLKRHEGGDDKPGRRSDNPFDRVAQEFGASRDDYPSLSQPQPSSTMNILTLLLRLRQCCCHLSLLKTSLDQVELKNEGIELTLEEQLSALTLSELHTSDPNSKVCLIGTSFQADIFENYRESTKITALMAELKTIQSGPGTQKSVIVSQWTSMLKVVAAHLKRVGLTYSMLDGSINPKQRMDLVEEFNNNPKGPQMMLVSLCAGGVGLNLIGGNHLFLLDMHWNPALEDQACDRIYRVGQRKNVVIHRFVCEGTVEEKISALQAKKKELATQVLSGKGDAVTKLTLADLKILFGV